MADYDAGSKHYADTDAYANDTYTHADSDAGRRDWRTYDSGGCVQRGGWLLSCGSYSQERRHGVVDKHW